MPVRRLSPVRVSVVRRGGSVGVPVVPRVGVSVVPRVGMSVVAGTIVGMPVRRMVVTERTVRDGK